MALWAVMTFGAHKMAPLVANIVEGVEVGLGFDVLPGQGK
jgi:hypothetical protein